MKLVVTKVLAKEINKRVENMSVSVVYMTQDEAEHYVSFFYSNHIEDYDWDKGKYKFFVVSYPENYYAMNAYVTQRDLWRIADYVSGDLTIDKLCKAFSDEYSI